jgi:hypothetical protein
MRYVRATKRDDARQKRCDGCVDAQSHAGQFDGQPEGVDQPSVCGVTSQFEMCVRKFEPQSIKLIAEGKVGARLVTYKTGMQAIMKIALTKTTKRKSDLQKGIPVETMPKREVAFYRLSKLLGFDVVPETILHNFHGYSASFQQYVTSAKLYDLEPRLRYPEKDKGAWVIALRETLRDKVPTDDTLRLTVLDFLACARDRHAANYGVRLDVSGPKARWRLVGWDNGCSFGLTQERYQCVAHKYLFRYALDLEPVWKSLLAVRRSDLHAELCDFIDGEAVEHIWHRVQFITLFPHRMPWKTLSQGSDSPETFPSYAAFFQPMVGSKPFYILQTQSM